VWFFLDLVDKGGIIVSLPISGYHDFFVACGLSFRKLGFNIGVTLVLASSSSTNYNVLEMPSNNLAEVNRKVKALLCRF